MNLFNKSSSSSGASHSSSRFSGWKSMLQLMVVVMGFTFAPFYCKGSGPDSDYFSQAFYLKSVYPVASKHKPNPSTSQSDSFLYLSGVRTFNHDVEPQFVNQMWSYSELFSYDVCNLQLKNLATQSYLNFSSAWIRSLTNEKKQQLHSNQLSYQQLLTELNCVEMKYCDIWVHFNEISLLDPSSNSNGPYPQRKKGVIQYSKDLNEFVLTGIVNTDMSGNVYRDEALHNANCPTPTPPTDPSPQSTTTTFELSLVAPIAPSLREVPVQFTVPSTPSTVCIHPEHPSFYSLWQYYHSLFVELPPLPEPICTPTDLTWFDRKQNMLNNGLHPNIYIFVLNLGTRTWNPLWDQELKDLVRKMESMDHPSLYHPFKGPSEYYHVFPHSNFEMKDQTIRMVPIAAPYKKHFDSKGLLNLFFQKYGMKVQNVIENAQFGHPCLPSFTSLPFQSLSVSASNVNEELLLLFHRTFAPSLRRTVPILPNLHEVDVYVVCDGLDAEFRRFPNLENAAVHNGWTLHDTWTSAVESVSTPLSYPLGTRSGPYIMDEIARLAPHAKFIPIRIPSETWDVMDLLKLIENIEASVEKRSRQTTAFASFSSSFSFSSSTSDDHALPRPSIVYLPLHFSETQAKMLSSIVPTLVSVFRSLPHIAFVISAPSWVILKHGKALGEVAMVVSKWDDYLVNAQLAHLQIPYHIYAPGRYTYAQPLPDTLLIEKDTVLPKVIELKSSSIATARAVGVLAAHWGSAPFFPSGTSAKQVMEFTMKVTWEPYKNQPFVHLLTDMCPNAQGPFHFTLNSAFKLYECVPSRPAQSGQLVPSTHSGPPPPPPIIPKIQLPPFKKPKVSNPLLEKLTDPKSNDIPKQSEVSSDSVNSNTQKQVPSEQPSRSFWSYMFGGDKKSHSYEF